MIYILCLCLLWCNAQATDDSWLGSDVKVVCRSGIFKSWGASFKGDDILVDGESLSKIGLDHVLQGYNFPEMKAPEGHPELLKSGVRQFICDKKPFFSEKLEKCLDEVVDALRQKKDIETYRNLSWDKLTADVAHQNFHQEGKAHMWSVVSWKKVTSLSSDNRVYLMFRGEDDALMGVLRPKNISEPVGRSLLSLRASTVDYPPLPTQDRVPIPEELIQPNCGSRYNVGIIYFPQKDPCAALIDGSLIDISRQYTWHKNFMADDRRSVFEILQEEMLAGFSLKRKSKAAKDINVLRQPHVRKHACVTHKFTSRAFERTLFAIEQFLQDADVTLQGHAFWRNLTENMCSEMLSARSEMFVERLVWSILSPKELEDQLYGFASKGTVLVLLRGEGVALKGRPNNVFIREQKSLLDLVNQKKIRERKQGNTAPPVFMQNK